MNVSGTGRAVGAVKRALSTLWGGRASRGRVAEWPVTDPILPVPVQPQDNATAKSIARMRSGERSRRRTFRQDPASGWTASNESRSANHVFTPIDA